MAYEKVTTRSGQLGQMAASGRGTVDTLKLVGFKVMLAWHYIVLFSPVLVAKTYYLEYTTLFSRQFTLYVTLLGSFALFMLIGRRLVKDGRAPSFGVLAFAGTFGVVATIVSELVFGLPRPVRIASVVVLGSAQALLMFLWLRFYAHAAEGHLIRSFSLDMLFGGTLAFFICNLAEPLNYVIAACLPVVATASLMLNWHDEGVPDTQPVGLLGEPLSKRRIALFSVKLSLPTAAFGFVFGMTQGAFLHVNVPLMIVSNSFVLGGGILLAGITIFAIKEAPGPFYVLDRLLRIALILFCCGVVGLILVRIGDFDKLLLLAFELLMLAGFNLIDFGSMVASFSVKRHVGGRVSSVVDSGRVLVYFALALGLLVGTLVPSMALASLDVVLVGICCIGLVVVLVVGMIPVRNLVKDDFARIVERSAHSAGKAPANGVCDLCPSMGIDCNPDLSGPVESCPVGAVKEQGPVAAMPAASEAAAPAVQPSGELAGAGVPSGLTAQAEVEPALPGTLSWAQACDIVAETYQLSRREKDVFVLIAKGRNAEFIQNELFISVHTVKTHMSHIYRKLDVHSSQELISLIEEYQQRS